MKKKKDPLIIELEAYHEGCPTIETGEKVNDSLEKLLSVSGSDKNGVYHINEFRSPEIDKYLKLISKHKGVKKIDVLVKGKDKAVVQLLTKDTMFVDSVGKTGCIVLPFTGTMDGKDFYTLLVPSQKAFDKLNDLLDGHYDFKLKSKYFLKPKKEPTLDIFNTSGFLKLKSAADLVTKKQLDAFQLAASNGYYDEPKRISIKELAGMKGISEAAFSELLRKAERKLLPILADIMKVMK